MFSRVIRLIIVNCDKIFHYLDPIKRRHLLKHHKTPNIAISCTILTLINSLFQLFSRFDVHALAQCFLLLREFVDQNKVGERIASRLHVSCEMFLMQRRKKKLFSDGTGSNNEVAFFFSPSHSPQHLFFHGSIAFENGN